MCNKNFENQLTKTNVVSKNIFEYGIFYGKQLGGEVIIFLENFKNLNILSKLPEIRNLTENLPGNLLANAKSLFKIIFWHKIFIC